MAMFIVFLLVSNLYLKSQSNTVFLTFEKQGETRVKTNNYEISNIKSKNGEGAVFLDKTKEFGPTLSFYNLPKTWIKSTVWKQGKGGGIVCSIEKNNYYQVEHTVIKTEGEWQQIEAYFLIPNITNEEELKIYLFNNQHSPIYFDDFKIEFMDEYPYSDFEKLPFIDLSISDDDLLKIDETQKLARKRGLIPSSNKKWMSIILNEGDGNSSAKARIKGDWLDHIENDKWSLRIKITDSSSVFNGAKTFSIQHPKTRSYLKEWLLHKVLEDEDVLTTKYDFVWVKRNGKSKGIYAFEQHFDKYLLERQNRKEAPIFKFNEDGFWEIIQLQIDSPSVKTKQQYYLLQIAEIECFKKKKTFNDSLLKAQFEKGSKLLNEFRLLNPDVLNYLDIEKFAKYIALTDVFENYHSLAWINLRFYLNPATGLIEPVVYDGYEDKPSAPFNSTPIVGYIDSGHDTIYNLPQGIITQLFQSAQFRKEYYHCLNEYSSVNFLNEVFEKYDDDITSLTIELQKEFKSYSFHREDYYKKAETVRTVLEYGKDKHLMSDKNQVQYYSMWKRREDNKSTSPSLTSHVLFPSIALKAKYVKDKLKLYNYHPQSIKIYAFVNNKGMVVDLPEPIVLNHYDPLKSVPESVLDILDIEKILYKVEGKTHQTKVNNRMRLSLNLNKN